MSFFVFVLGAIVGSFLNVVALRYGTGLPLAQGRSQCFSCGKVLRWYELVPILSFLFLAGRCSACKSKISWQYPAVELITGALFLATFCHFGLSLYLPYYLFIESVLVVIAIYDLKHKIIPDGLVFLFGAVTLIGSLANFFYDGGSFLDVLAGPIVALPFAALWAVSKGRWIGLGDAKLALGIGFMLGLVQAVSAIVLAFWIGALWSIILLATQKIMQKRSLPFHVTIKSEIPFGPFLIIGTLLVFFFGWDVMGIAYFF